MADLNKFAESVSVITKPLKFDGFEPSIVFCTKENKLSNLMIAVKAFKIMIF